MRSCKACGTTNPPRGFYSPTDKTCRNCRDARRVEQWRDRYQNDPDFREAQLKRNKERRHNLGEDRRLEILAAQDGKCAICRQDPGDKSLFVDHDHTCCPGKESCGECVRGLLCQHCNSILGFARDDAAVLANAIAYLAATSSPM